MTVSKLGFPGIREFLMWISRYGSPLGKKISESKMFKVYEIVSISSGASYELLVDNTQNPTGDVLNHVIDVRSDKSIDIAVLDNVTVSNNGTPITLKPYNSGDTVETGVKVYSLPTYTGGVEIDGGYIGGGFGHNALGGSDELYVVTVVRKNRQVVIRFTNLDIINEANAKIRIEMSEV